MAKKTRVGDYLSGRILTNKEFVKRLPLLLYLSLLMFAYMTYNFRIQAKYDDLNQLKNEIKSYHSIYVTTSVQRVKMTRQEEIEKLLKKFKIELEPCREAPEVIE